MRHLLWEKIISLKQSGVTILLTTHYMDEADRVAFLKEIGIEEPARDRFIRASYRLLDLISFLTAGEDEVRAWTIPEGTVARKAAAIERATSDARDII